MALNFDGIIESGIRAGDSLKWMESLSDYPATEYTLKIGMRGGSAVDLAAVASGSDDAFDVPPAVTGAWTAGSYSWVAYVEKAGASCYIEL